MTASLPLSSAFVEAWPNGPDAPAPSEELEDRLQALCDTGRTAWPQAGLEAAQFARHLAPRCVVGETGPPDFSGLHPADLYLACACALGLPQAMALFEAHYMSRVPAFVRRLDPSGALAGEVAQDLRIWLLMPAAGTPAGVGAYSGRGELGAWLRVVALRAALKLRRSQRRLGVGGELPSAELGRGPDPELDVLRLRYRDDYQAAFASALASLESAERLLLKLHYADGLNIDRIGAIYRLHRSTVARRLASHRRKLLDLTRGQLRQRLGLSDSEFESVLALVRSQLVLSLRGALR